MPHRIFSLLLTLFFLFAADWCKAQQFRTQGSAVQADAYTYTITPDATARAGMVTNYYPQQLSKNFTIAFELNFGTKDASGADGFAFLLSNVCAPTLSLGQGLGVSGIDQSIVVEFDTWDNGSNNNDIPQDHVGIYSNGQLNLAGNIMDGTTVPVCMLSNCANMEDGQWHNIEIRWEYLSATSQRLSVFINGNLRTSSTRNHIAERFNNTQTVFWSVSGSTGGSSNLHQFRVAPNNNNLINGCEGKVFTLNAPEMGSNYQWSGGSSSVNNQATYTALRSTTITCNYTDFCGQNNAVNFIVTVYPNPVAQVADQVACAAKPATVKALPDDADDFNYEWQVPSGVPNPGNKASFTTTVAGNYAAVIESKLSGCRSEPATGSLRFTPATRANFTAVGPYCLGDNIPSLPTLSLNGIPGTWSPALNNQRTTSYGFNPDPSVCAVADSLQIVIQLPPTVTLIKDTSICKGSPLLLTPVVSGVSLNYLWQDGSTAPSFSVTQAGTFTVGVSNRCGTTSASVKISEVVCELFVPNAFTPNGDGLNDLFRIRGGAGIQDFSMQIFNRWGKLIFETNDPQIGWDGTLNGIPQPTGAYAYSIQYTRTDSQSSSQRKGMLQLLR